MAYSPQGVALGTGLTAALASPNKWIGAGLVVATVTYDTVAVYLQRRFGKDD